MTKAYVYQIRNLVNDKIYIGSTKNYKNRKGQHFTQLRKDKHDNNHLQGAWNKYGEDNFVFEVLEECDLDKQYDREQYYLNKLKPFGDDGYNLAKFSTFREYVNYHKKTYCEICDLEFIPTSRYNCYCDECKKNKQSDINQLRQRKRDYEEFLEKHSILDIDIDDDEINIDNFDDYDEGEEDWRYSHYEYKTYSDYEVDDWTAKAWDDAWEK